MFLGGQHTSNGIYITSSIVSAFRCLTKAQRQYLPRSDLSLLAGLKILSKANSAHVLIHPA